MKPYDFKLESILSKAQYSGLKKPFIILPIEKKHAIKRTVQIRVAIIIIHITNPPFSS